METGKKILEILHQFNIYGIEMNDSVKLIDDIGLDSLSFLQLITALEKQFNIKIQEDELSSDNFYTLNNLIKYIDKKVKDK